MLKFFLVLIIATISLTGCTASIHSESFITQDNHVEPILNSDIQKWKGSFPGYELHQISLSSKDGSVTLTGLFFDKEDSNDLLYFIPGNGMKISLGGIETMKNLAQLDQDMIVFDRRGLGASSGNATVQSLLSDADEQIEYIRQKVRPDSITVHGFSLGSFIATQVARKHPIDRLVLQGAATNANEWVDAIMAWYIKPFVSVEIDKDIIDLDNKLVLAKEYKGPLLIISAEQDEQVPSCLSEELYKQSSSEDKQLIIVKGANHGNMFSDATVVQKYKMFVKKQLVATQ